MNLNASNYLLGIVGAILGVYFKVFTLRKYRQTRVYFVDHLTSLSFDVRWTFPSHLIHKASSNGHGVVPTHV